MQWTHTRSIASKHIDKSNDDIYTVTELRIGNSKSESSRESIERMKIMKSANLCMFEHGHVDENKGVFFWYTATCGTIVISTHEDKETCDTKTDMFIIDDGKAYKFNYCFLMSKDIEGSAFSGLRKTLRHLAVSRIDLKIDDNDSRKNQFFSTNDTKRIIMIGNVKEQGSKVFLFRK